MEAHHRRLLTAAAEAWDRAQEAREALAKHGTTFLDRFKQPKMRPEVLIERDSKGLFARLVRELGLDVVDSDGIKPPIIAGNSHRRVG